MSWFRRQKAPSQPSPEPELSPVNVDDGNSPPAGTEAPIPCDDTPAVDESALRPVQMQDKRYTQLSFTPSEEQLYLAALDALKSVTPAPLPLWTESAPALPPFKASTTPIPNPSVPYPTNSMMLATSLPPGSPAFPTSVVPHHGLVTLMGDNGIRLTGFSATVVADVEKVLKTWPFGLGARSEPPEMLARCRKQGEVLVWRAELRGKVWRLKGNQELESCRLLISLFTTLGKHGYFLTSGIQAASPKSEQHNLVFRFTPEVDPPCFMAVTLPLPDRVTLVNPPGAVVNKLVEAVRAAITGTNDRAVRTPTKTPSVPATSPPGQAIKLEGFIHPGVYRFWIAGLRRWKVGPGGVKRDIVAKFQPPLLLAIMDALASQHFAFVTSVPFFPQVAGRDLLIFCSRPQSGLSASDGYDATETDKKAKVPAPPVAERPLSYQAEPRSPDKKISFPQLDPYLLRQRQTSHTSQESRATFQTQQTQVTHMERLSRNSSFTSTRLPIPTRLSSLSLQPPGQRTSYHSYNSFGSNHLYEPSLDPQPRQPDSSPLPIPAATRTASPSLLINGHAPRDSLDTQWSAYSKDEAELHSVPPPVPPKSSLPTSIAKLVRLTKANPTPTPSPKSGPTPYAKASAISARKKSPIPSPAASSASTKSRPVSKSSISSPIPSLKPTPSPSPDPSSAPSLSPTPIPPIPAPTPKPHPPELELKPNKDLQDHKQPDTPAFEYDTFLTPTEPGRITSPTSSISGYYTPLASPIPEDRPVSTGPLAPPRSPLREVVGKEYPWGASSPTKPTRGRTSIDELRELEFGVKRAHEIMRASPTPGSEVSYASSARPPGVGSARTRFTLGVPI